MHDELRALQQQILLYLQGNICAAETAEGVNSAWLHRSSIPAAIAEVEQALDELVRSNALEKHRLPGGVVVYRRRRSND
jgi:hypothetical protein